MADTHQHLLIECTLKQNITDEKFIKNWLRRLVKILDMEVFGGPYVKYCHDEGNDGLSGFIWLKTSHISVHFWNNNGKPFLKFDAYSCRKFGLEPVINHLEKFNLITVDYMMIDRSTPPATITNSGVINYAKL